MTQLVIYFAPNKTMEKMRNWVRRMCIGLSLFSCCFITQAQTVNVKLIDALTEEPVPDVAAKVYSNGHFLTLLSNKNGVVHIENSPTVDSINLTHTAFVSTTYSMKSLKKMGYVVQLQTQVFVKPAFEFRHNPDFEQQVDQVTKVLTIRPREVKLQNPQTTADLIGLSNQVFIQKSQMGGGSPMIRGFSANNVLIVVDGVRMNNAIFRDGNIQNIITLDPHIVDRTQVVFGPGSVIYGSDAMGGVMAFETKTPRISEKQYYDGNVMLRAASANKETSWHVDLGYGKGKFSGLSSISLSNYGDLRMGSVGPEEYTRPIYTEYNGTTDTIIQNPTPNVQYFTSYSQLNINQKFRFKPDSSNDFVLHFGYTTSSPIPRYDRLLQTRNNQPRYGDWLYGPQKWTQLNGRYLHQFKKGKLANSMVATLAFQNFGESRFVRSFRTTYLEHNAEKVNVYSANIDFDKKIKKLDFLYGIELVSNLVSSVGTGSDLDSGLSFDIATRYPDGSTMNTAAAYVSANRKIKNKWLISSGLRHSYISLKAPFANSFYNFPFTEIELKKGALSGSLGLRYMLNKKSFMFLNAASGFRAPNIDDMGKIFDSQPDRVIVPNPNLQPEFSYNGEIGFFAQFKGRIELMVNAYYTVIDNIIVRSDFSVNGQDSLLYQGQKLRIQSLTNSDQGTVMGLESQLKIPITYDLTLKTGYNVISGSTSDGNPLRHVSPNFGNTNLSWNHGRYNLVLYANYNAEISNSDLAPSEQSKTHIYAADENGLPYSPAWWTLNIKGGITFSKSLKLNLGFENLLDKRYRPYSSGLSAPGRNLIISIYGRF